MENIEEIIADAKAEEEVAKEQEKAEKEQAFKNDFKKALTEQLKDALFKGNRESQKITIDLDEYLTLKFKERDLDKLTYALMSNLELGYNNQYLILKDSLEIPKLLRVLYPEAYDAIYEDLLNEGE